MKHKKSKRKSINKRTSKMSPGEQRRSTILARIGYYKEDAIIKSISSLLIALTICRFTPDHKVKIFFGALITTLLALIIPDLMTTGLYMLYFEVAKFGWPKEKLWIKYRKIINYIFLAIFIATLIGVNIIGGSAMNELNKLKAQQVAERVSLIPEDTFSRFPNIPMDRRASSYFS